MQDKAPFWVDPVMRFGYGARGVVYLIVGYLALLAAWTGGQAEGTKGALAQLRDEPGGTTMLWIVALGLLAYAVWRFICALLDLENFGQGAKAAIARTGQTISGAIHLGLAFSAARMAWGGGGSGGENGDGGSAQSLASKALATDWGQPLIMAVGVVTICAGLFYGYKAWAEKYKEHLRLTRITRKLDPVVKIGLVAHGVVIVLLGVFLFYAGQNTDPGQAGGIGKAFATVRAQPFGRILLALLALGTIAFTVYCWVEAIWRVIPRRAGPDVQTLAHQAEHEAKRAGREAERAARG